MKYTESHEWIDQQGVVGVSDYAQQELGDIVYVELPEIGKTVQAGEDVVVLESTKAAADVYAPVSGTILEVNETLNTSPELINESPQEKGWLFKIAIHDPSELERLMDEQNYRAQFTS